MHINHILLTSFKSSNWTAYKLLQSRLIFTVHARTKKLNISRIIIEFDWLLVFKKKTNRLKFQSFICHCRHGIWRHTRHAVWYMWRHTGHTDGSGRKRHDISVHMSCKRPNTCHCSCWQTPWKRHRGPVNKPVLSSYLQMKEIRISWFWKIIIAAYRLYN